MRQCTLKKTVTFEGVGLHTGVSSTLTIHPADCNHGFKFRRVDLEKPITIPADVNKVNSTNRCTTLKVGEARVSTVEHVLSALVGCGIDNALLEINAEEVPILDGSAQPFVDAFLKAGIEEQKEEATILKITEPINYKDEATGAELTILPNDHFAVYTLINFDSEVLGHQYATLNDLKDYSKEIASCKTFVFIHELEHLLDQNLIKGGSLDNAIVIANEKMDAKRCTELAKKLGRDNIEVSEKGILNTVELNFANEPARHKLLDVIGDLALVGARIQGKVIANKPGHTANIELAKKLKAKLQLDKKLRGKPTYDPTIEPLYDTMQIASMLPHRYPFLLVDKVIELSESHVVGVKNVTFNENFFQGHFPNNPVFPGVLQIEAMAQTGGILALSTVPDPSNWDTYFLKIDNAKFKYKVTPGDTLIFKLELKAPIRRGIVQMLGTAYVGNRIVSEADLTAQIVRRSTV